MVFALADAAAVAAAAPAGSISLKTAFVKTQRVRALCKMARGRTRRETCRFGRDNSYKGVRQSPEPRDTFSEGLVQLHGDVWCMDSYWRFV